MSQRQDEEAITAGHSPMPNPSRGKPAARVRKPYYDRRIDFFRGLSLIFIFINHIPDNVYSYLTLRSYALFDSAEVFMFLAGYSAAMAYYSLQPGGLQAFSMKAGRRAWSILSYHVLLVAFVMLSALAISRYADVKTGYEVFLERLTNDPAVVLTAIPLLAFQAPLLDILPMYVIVMLMAPFLIWLRVRGELVLLSASALLWLFASRFFPAIPTATYGVFWNFNPFCWQLLFAIGLVFGWRARSQAQPVASGEARRVLDTCCLLVVVFSACVLLAIAFQTFSDATANRLRAMYFSLNKQCLDIWRLTGLLASAYLAARLVSKEAQWLDAPASRLIAIAGARSLPIFSLTVVLSFLGKFAVIPLGGTELADTAVTVTGVVAIFGVAAALEQRAATHG